MLSPPFNPRWYSWTAHGHRISVGRYGVLNTSSAKPASSHAPSWHWSKGRTWALIITAPVPPLVTNPPADATTDSRSFRRGCARRSTDLRRTAVISPGHDKDVKGPWILVVFVADLKPSMLGARYHIPPWAASVVTIMHQAQAQDYSDFLASLPISRLFSSPPSFPCLVIPNNSCCHLSDSCVFGFVLVTHYSIAIANSSGWIFSLFVDAGATPRRHFTIHLKRRHPISTKMPDKVLMTFLLVDALFLASGGLLLAVVFTTRARKDSPRTTDNVASDLLLMDTPLDGKPKAQLSFGMIASQC